jgi:hypothetical protein
VAKVSCTDQAYDGRTNNDEAIAMTFPRRNFLQWAAVLPTAMLPPLRLPGIALLLPAIELSTGAHAADCDASNCGAGRAMPFRQGPYFNHAFPAGWEVVKEDNQLLVLQSRDRLASITVTGVVGLKEQTSPEVFAFQQMSMLGLTNVRFQGLLYISPMSAYEGAAMLDVAYTSPNGPMRGFAISNIANFHRGNTYIRTDAMIAVVGAKESLWEAYADWLPLVALQAVNNGPDPFGDPAAPASSPGDAERLNIVATEHRDWAKRTWDEVVEYRAKALAGLTTPAPKRLYDNPYGGPPIEQSATPAAIWINSDGQQFPTDNPAFDPRTPTDSNWQRLVPKKP